MNRLLAAWTILTGGTKAVATIIPTWQRGQPVYPDFDFENFVKHGWQRNELIFSCISKTANTAASVSLEVKSSEDDKPLDNHPLRQLLKKPNPHMSEFDFWASVIIYLKLAGVAYYEKERSIGGDVVRLWPLRPDWIRPIPGGPDGLLGYEYWIPGVEPFLLAVEDVLDFKSFDPLNMFKGTSPTAVAARTGDVDNSITDFLSIFFREGGIPAGLLKTKQKLVDTQVADIRRRWRERYGGYQNWLDPAVLDSDAEYQKIGLDFNEMGFENLDARDEVRICMIMDIPPIIVGAKAGLDRSTFSNYAEARTAWWEDSLIPLYKHINDEIAEDLVPEFGDSITTGWDFTNVPALKKDDSAKWESATRAYRSTAITLNQFASRTGLEEQGTEGDKYFYRGQLVTLQELAEGIETDNGSDLPSADENIDDDLDKSFKAINPPDDDDRRKKERKMTKALEGYFTDQLGRIRVDLSG